MSISTDKVKELNSKIDKLNIERTKIETQREFLENQLKESIAKYKEKYNVDLNVGSSLKNISDAISAELDKVSKQIEAEYELKTSIVNAIESGDIAYANKLMGVTSSAPPVTEEVPDDTEADRIIKKAEKVAAQKVEKPKDVIEDISGDEDLLDLSGYKGNKVNEDINIPDDYIDEAEDEDVSISEEFVDSSEDDDNADDVSFNDNDIILSDEDIVLDDDFGFDEMIKGTKLEI